MNRRSLVVIGLAACLAACTEPRAPQHAAVPTPGLEARLELSDSLPVAGSRITVSVMLRGESASRVASFTGRVSYDTTGLRFVDEVPLSDGATRISNPTPGLVRAAAVRADGFASGTLAEFRFDVVRPAAVQGMRLAVDELHQLDNVDASRTVRVTGAPVARIP